MRVGLVCPYDLGEPGGVQEQVLGLSRVLHQLGDEVSVLAPGLPDGVDGVDLGSTRRVPGNRSIAPISLSPTMGRLLSEATGDLDVLHVHEPLMPAVSLAALRSGPPVVATFHADPPRWGHAMYGVLRPVLGRILGPRVRVITAVSEVAAKPIGGAFDVTVIPNGVDVSRFEVAGDRDPLRVAFLGRDEPRKGLDVLLEAWAMVTSRVPGSRLTVMGANRITPGVEWLGRVDEETKAGVLAGSAVYVAPNLGGESFGIVLVEAMAAGTPVVASGLPSFRAVGGSAVVYVEPGDVTALADALSGLLEDAARRRELGSAARERAREFDWTVVGRRYREAYALAATG